MDSFQKLLLNKTQKGTKPTFKSFISPGVIRPQGNEEPSCAERVEDGCICNGGQDNVGGDIVTLQGEIVISRAEEVSKSFPYGLNKEDEVGTLFVTNYRVVFLPYNQSTTRNSYDSTRRNKLIGLEDIALSSIFGVYHVSKGRRKRLLPNVCMSGFVKVLQLHCKDFRFHQFGFEKSLRDHVKVLVNAILYHYFPVNVELLYAFTYVDSNLDDEISQPSVLEFLLPEDWQFELKRVGARGFSVSSCNKEFALSDSLPENFVLPASLTDALTLTPTLGFNNNSLPIWSYSYSNGCALIRMAYGSAESEEEMAAYVKRSHPARLPPEVVDVGSTALPSLKKLQSSFEQLREICMPSSYKELANGDYLWFAMLDGSQWLYFVSIALSIASEIADLIAVMNKTVIVKERDGADYNALLSALVQLLLDPECRTIFGFQTLIEKEWVAMGHRFSQRCDVVCSKDAEQSPIFLLFLDCTSQLLQQFPSSFEFTEIFLISIWDGIGLGMFRNFIFSSPKERSEVEASISHNSKLSQKPFPLNVWDWKKQFFSEDITFFTSPLFSAQEQIRNLPALNEKSRTKFEHSIKSRILVPCCFVAGLKFWENCYLRWLGPLQIIGGGKPSEYISQTLIMEDITSLQMAISELEDAIAPKRAKRQRVFKFVCGDSSSNLRRELSKHVSSSYPFSPSQDFPHVLLLPVHSSDSRNSASEDMFSVDELSLADCSEL